MGWLERADHQAMKCMLDARMLTERTFRQLLSRPGRPYQNWFERGSSAPSRVIQMGGDAVVLQVALAPLNTRAGWRCRSSGEDHSHLSAVNFL
jgi:hypothetical protein